MRKGSDADGLGIELVSLDVFFDDVSWGELSLANFAFSDNEGLLCLF
jgi:hypothetical protein